MSAERFFNVEHDDDVLVISPTGDIAAAEQDAVQADVTVLLAALAAPELRHVVFDFLAVPYFGSAMLETMLALWRDVRSRGGRLAVCNVSTAERELLATVKFDTLWPIGRSREEALAAVRRRT